MISQTQMPAFQLGQDILVEAITTSGLVASDRSVLVVADSYWTTQPAFDALKRALEEAAATVTIFADFAGEPKLDHIRAAMAAGRAAKASLVIGMGGGSALDIAKMAAACVATGEDPAFYALGANPIPDRICDLIQVPTTAGTGSEANGTAIFADETGGKLWAFGTALKPKLAVLDAALLLSLPADLKAWCGMDALIHAFEAGSNRWSNPVNLAHATRALELIVPALPKAQKGDVQAHEDLLLGSFVAGFAIENTGTSIAHCASHAMARFAPIHHGLATALAFELTLAHVVAQENTALSALALACGTTAQNLPDHISSLMSELGIKRVLPAGFEAVSAGALAQEMQAPANAPMRNAALIDTSDKALTEIAAAILQRAA